MKNLLDEDKKNKNGMDLGSFILKYEKKLKGMRCLYVIRANLEQGLLKFGIANNAYNRLRDYEIAYGTNNDINACQGVFIYFCGVVKYNSEVPIERSSVGLMEKDLKRHFQSVTEEKRGTERVRAELKDILKFIKCNKRADRFKSVQIRKDVKERSALRRSEVQKKRQDKEKKKKN